MPKERDGDKEGDPDWVLSDIRSSVYQEPETVRRVGYILELDDPEKIDVQLYDPVEDGRHIITMSPSKDINVGELERGVVYEMVFDQRKAPLSRRVLEYMKSRWSLEMDALYEFELKSVMPVDGKEGGGRR